MINNKEIHLTQSLTKINRGSQNKKNREMSCTVEDNRLPAIYVGYTITCDFFPNNL